MNQNSVLIFMVRVGTACLGTATLLYVFWPESLNSFAGFLYFHQALICVIEGYPGFDRDWLSVISLITVSAHIYCYLAATLIVANVLHPLKAGVFQSSNGRDQWNLLSYVIVGRLAPRYLAPNESEPATDYQGMLSIIRAYSKSREGMASVVLDIVTVISASYIGYSALQAPPTYGGLLVRFIDALIAGLWCYCIFSIFMWVIFILLAWLRYLSHRI